ncbi:hypothetical protein PtA15_7A784 [Puccinia triticina]|uniref:Shugoshin C-terminal domain-containing protein n=1 Tax=Puccinia triticina TaxID=208348 RepID=A0ABY7CPU0_9BASI|nr:uncharacterized protein PtA15_7A784 [Puccinia triticina]WAQ87055.1 hypothetical protein PtA15_7A784 [Puccinia triticina]WAR56912.1 hypothetical protein PtB15_7B765 [Puccinia triticina]
MAVIQEVEDEAPSTPLNTHPDTSNSVPESARRKSSRLRTPSSCPGFIPTSCDFRRALVGPVNPTKKKRQAPTAVMTFDDESGPDVEDDCRRSKGKNQTSNGRTVSHKSPTELARK